MNLDHSQHPAEPKAFWGSRSSIGLIVLSSVALYFLLTEHRAHFVGALPVILLLACLLMHVFMHGGHGGHGGGHDRQLDGKQHADEAGAKQAPGSGDRS